LPPTQRERIYLHQLFYMTADSPLTQYEVEFHKIRKKADHCLSLPRLKWGGAAAPLAPPLDPPLLRKHISHVNYN